MAPIGPMRDYVALIVALAAFVLVVGAAASAAQPLLSHKRLVVDRTVVSPDGKSVAYLTHLRPVYLREESIRVKTVGEPTRILYRSKDSCCDQLTWLSPTRLVFDDDYRVTTLDIPTGRIRRIAGFSNFRISPDHTWIAGWADSGGHEAQTVRVVSADGTSCKSIPTPARHTDLDASFSRDGTLHVYRATFSVDSISRKGRWLAFRIASLPHAPMSACLS
jgi:hypothetical protein